MLEQNIDHLLPLLQMLPQPAFCVREDGQVLPNTAARHLAPASGSQFLHWLGESQRSYADWNGVGTLALPVYTSETTFQVSICRVADGLFCLMIPCEPPDAASLAMMVTAQVLRQPLADLSGQLQHLEHQLDSALCQEYMSAMQRQIYRLSRVTANLSDWEQLRSGAWRRKITRLNVPEDLEQFLLELQDLCRETGREFLWKTPKKTVSLSADPNLLKRAILNLISNAIKYSPAGTPIALRAIATDTHLLFQVDNVCDEDAQSLLHSAFHRLEQRDVLPDPRWGVGLGLPIAQAIARLHGGMVALEVKKQTVTVTLSMRCRLPEDPTLRTPQFSYTGGMSQTLMELADILPNQLYHTDCI